MLPHRGLVHRLLAGLLALLFAGSAMEGAGAHACPMHDGSMVAATLAAAEAAARPAPAAAHDAHAAHGANATHAAAPAPGHEQGGHEGGHHCTCPDDACSTGIVALATPRLSTHFGIAVADVRTVFAPATSHRPTRVPHATPFANGPPAAALA